MFDFSEFFAVAGAELERRKQLAATAVEQFVAVKVIGQAQEYCPIETGALMASGTWSTPVVEQNQITIECGFNVDYAAARHEGLPYDAPPKQNPKSSGNKWLERAIREATPQLAPWIEQAIGEGGQRA